jgi:hypothetical protein
MAAKRHHVIIRACAYGIAYLCLCLFVACAQETPSPRPATDSGALSVQIVWPELPENDNPQQGFRGLGNACEAYGVATVVFTIYDAQANQLVNESFACDLGYAEVNGIPAGEGRSLEVVAESANGVTRYGGQMQNITISANTITPLGNLALQNYPVDAGSIQIANATPYALTEIYVSTCDCNNWGENMTTEPIEAYASSNLVYFPPGCYDVRICDEYSNCSEGYDYQVYTDIPLTITHSPSN